MKSPAAFLVTSEQAAVQHVPFSAWICVVIALPTVLNVPTGRLLALPFTVITIEAGLRSMDTRLEDAAASLGAGRWFTLGRVTLPLLGPLFKNKGGDGADIHLQISQFAVLTSTIMLQVVGLIAGLLPAVKASRLDPIDALRYE